MTGLLPLYPRENDKEGLLAEPFLSVNVKFSVVPLLLLTYQFREPWHVLVQVLPLKLERLPPIVSAPLICVAAFTVEEL